MGPAHADQRPLGELIVARGLVTLEEVEDALFEQRITRKRLGTILVSKTAITATDLTSVLVDQIGAEEAVRESSSPTRGESANGPSSSGALRRWLGLVGRASRHVQEPDDEVRMVRPAELVVTDAYVSREDPDASEFAPEPLHAPTPASGEAIILGASGAAFETARTPDDSTDELAAAVEGLRDLREAAQADLGELRRELERTTVELVRARDDVAERDARIVELEIAVEAHEKQMLRMPELKSKLARLNEALVATEETLSLEIAARRQSQQDTKRMERGLEDYEARPAKLTRRVVALEDEVQAVVSEREQALHRLPSRERRLTALESTIEELRAQTENVEVAPEPAVTVPEPDRAPAVREAATRVELAESVSGYLLFFPRPGEGYRLVEREGEPPDAGDRIELDNGSFEVARHGISPMPFDRRICVFLRT